MKPYFSYTLATVLGFALLPTLSAQVLRSAPTIVCDQPVHRFGERDASEKVNHSFVLRNEGTAPLRISQVKPDCGCTAADLRKRVLEPGEQATVKVSFNLSGRQGPQLKRIIVHSNDPSQPAYTLRLEGEAVSENVWTPRHLLFGNVKKGQAATQVLDLQARANRPFRVSKVVALRKHVETRLETVQEGTHYRIHVDLPEQAAEGRLTDSLRIHTDHPSMNLLTIAVTGNVVGPISVLPNTLFLVDNGRAVTRYLMVTPGTADQVHVTKVAWPGEEGEQAVRIIPNGTRGVRIQLRNVTPKKELHGKHLVLHTDVPGAERVTIPINVRTSSGRPVRAPATHAGDQP